MKLTLDQTPKEVEINGVKFVHDGQTKNYKPTEYSIIRTYSAGVHLAIVKSLDGTRCETEDDRIIWSWGRNALTLHEVATDGIDEGKVSKPVPSNILTQAIEVMPCSEQAYKSIVKLCKD